MAHLLTPKECYTLINALAKQAGAETGLVATDTSSFISVGERILATGTENVMNSLSILIGRTLVATRPYKSKLGIIQAENSDLYNTRLRKISVYKQDAQSSGAFNTDLFTNFKKGYDNGSNGGQSVASMWEQKPSVPLEMNFSGVDVWDEQVTLYENQFKQAFRSEAEFSAFISAVMTEKSNDIEMEKEAFRRAVLLNHIAGAYDLSAVRPGTVVNLTTLYNQEYGTSYTAQELRTTYIESFAKFFVETFKKFSDQMTYRTTKFHWSPTKTVDGQNYVLMRHTSKENQRFVYYAPLWTKVNASVMPGIFNTQYLQMPQGEGVDFWQAIDDPAKVSVTPAIPDVNSAAGQQIAGDPVALDYVVGVLFDKDTMMTDMQLESVATTPLEARKMYRNQFWHFAKNGINDFTENSIIFIM